MNKEQQIKEMTQDFINFGITTRQGVEAFAEILYNAGYRKISEDNICEAVEKPVNTPKRKYESIEDIVRGFVNGYDSIRKTSEDVCCTILGE